MSQLATVQQIRKVCQDLKLSGAGMLASGYAINCNTLIKVLAANGVKLMAIEDPAVPMAVEPKNKKVTVKVPAKPKSERKAVDPKPAEPAVESTVHVSKPSPPRSILKKVAPHQKSVKPIPPEVRVIGKDDTQVAGQPIQCERIINKNDGTDIRCTKCAIGEMQSEDDSIKVCEPCHKLKMFVPLFQFVPFSEGSE